MHGIAHALFEVYTGSEKAYWADPDSFVIGIEVSLLDDKKIIIQTEDAKFLDFGLLVRWTPGLTPDPVAPTPADWAALVILLQKATRAVFETNGERRDEPWKSKTHDFQILMADNGDEPSESYGT